MFIKRKHRCSAPCLLGIGPLQIGLWRAAECVSLQVAELRTLMPELDATELAVAGHAVALSQWHVVRPTAQHLKDVVHSS